MDDNAIIADDMVLRLMFEEYIRLNNLDIFK